MPTPAAGFALKTLGIVAAGLVIAGSRLGSGIGPRCAEGGAELFDAGVRTIAGWLPHAAAIFGVASDSPSINGLTTTNPSRPHADHLTPAQIDPVRFAITAPTLADSIRRHVPQTLELVAERPEERAVMRRTPEGRRVEPARYLVRAGGTGDRARTIETEARLVERQAAEAEESADRWLRLSNERLVLEIECR